MTAQETTARRLIDTFYQPSYVTTLEQARDLAERCVGEILHTLKETKQYAGDVDMEFEESYFDKVLKYIKTVTPSDGNQD